jgi:hypothetical protein
MCPQVEAINSEMEQLRNQLIQKGQQAYHGPLQQLSAESPEVTKLHKQVRPLPTPHTKNARIFVDIYQIIYIYIYIYISYTSFILYRVDMSHACTS